jgi:hypothetical protein
VLQEDAIHRQCDSNEPSEYTPLSDPIDSDSKEEPIRVASEFRSYVEESPTIPALLHGLLFQLGITKAQSARSRAFHDQGAWSSSAHWMSSMDRMWSAGTLVPLL